MNADQRIGSGGLPWRRWRFNIMSRGATRSLATLLGRDQVRKSSSSLLRSGAERSQLTSCSAQSASNNRLRASVAVLTPLHLSFASSSSYPAAPCRLLRSSEPLLAAGTHSWKHAQPGSQG